MNWRQIHTVYRKELTDTLRDRRSLISMFVVPIVLIPALMFGMFAMTYKSVRKAYEEIPTVMLVGGAESPRLREELAANKRIKLAPYADDYATQIENKQLRAAIEAPDDFDAILASGAKAPVVTICSYAGDMRSGAAADEVARFLSAYLEKVVRRRLAEQELPENFHRPFLVRRKNVAPPEKVGGAQVGGLIPYLLILLSFTGAMYSALDLTAGEKERGTMETILCSPVGRTELVLGKFLMVLTASLVTVVCSLASLGATAVVAVRMLAGEVAAAGGAAAGGGAAAAGGGLPMTVSLPGVLGVCALVVPLAVLFSAVLFSVALCAKNYKEAQSYVSPLIFVIILPAALAMLPGVELNATYAMVPLMNVALVSKEMVSGNFPAGMIALIFGSTCVYAAAALAIAVRMFKKESVIFRA
ncbi:MAG: ABC transporter permease [Opitutaceae bacterium]|jgi:sodium transport system permease protein|nr:ABC transporter permease [Opitutaceae bacterium]